MAPGSACHTAANTRSRNSDISAGLINGLFVSRQGQCLSHRSNTAANIRSRNSDVRSGLVAIASRMDSKYRHAAANLRPSDLDMSSGLIAIASHLDSIYRHTAAHIRSRNSDMSAGLVMSACHQDSINIAASKSQASGNTSFAKVASRMQLLSTACAFHKLLISHQLRKSSCKKAVCDRD